MMMMVTYEKCFKYSRSKDFMIHSLYLKQYCREAMKNNNKKITKNKRFNRLKLISEGLPMPINKIKDCLNCFFNEKDVCKILKESKIYTITY